jgi:hypothetical protein
METLASLIKVLWAPQETLFRVAKHPRLIGPLIFITLFAVVEAAMLMVRVDSGQLRLEQWRREGIADKLSQEDQLTLMTSARKQQQRLAIISAAVRPLLITVAALVFFGCFSIIGRTAGFKVFFSLTTFSFVPLAVRSLMSIVALFILTPSPRVLEAVGSVSPALFIDPQSVPRVAYVGAGLIDLVSLWILALLVVGYGFVVSSKVSIVHRVIVVAGVWIVYASIRLWLANVANV